MKSNKHFLSIFIDNYPYFNIYNYPLYLFSQKRRDISIVILYLIIGIFILFMFLQTVLKSLVRK